MLIFASVQDIYGDDRRVIIGIVRDSVTTEGLPYASISVDGTGKGTVADDRGIFEIAVDWNANSITAACQGYAKKQIPLVSKSHNLYDI